MCGQQQTTTAPCVTDDTHVVRSQVKEVCGQQQTTTAPCVTDDTHVVCSQVKEVCGQQQTTTAPCVTDDTHVVCVFTGGREVCAGGSRHPLQPVRVGPAAAALCGGALVSRARHACRRGRPSLRPRAPR